MSELPPSLTSSQREILAAVVEALSAVPEVAALALGGSHVRGFATAGSDLDLGIYYRRDRPLEIDRLARVASTLCDAEPALTPLWDWGPWMNGGGWLRIRGQPVDWIYRELDHIRETLAHARAGRIELHYGQQPPAGFHSYTLLGELHACLPLWDPRGDLSALRREVDSPPPELTRAIARSGLSQVDFALLHARAAASRGDVSYTVRCLARIATYLDQVLFALNETWFVSDKTAAREIARFARAPAAYGQTLARILAAPGGNARALCDSVARTETLYEQVLALAPGRYTRRFAAGKPTTPGRAAS